MGKKLNAQLIQMKCKTDKLATIEKINLWGNDLEDVSILREMPNLEVISLSLNKIYTLEDFAYCGKLNELYLRKNDVSDLKEVHFLAHLPNLEVLWLWDNPVCAHKCYRPFIIKLLPNLKKLDNEDVSPEERAASASMQFDEEDLAMANISQAPTSLPEPILQIDPTPAYESPAKSQYSELMGDMGPGGVQRTPPKMQSEHPSSAYGGMPDPTPPQSVQSPVPSQEPWSKGGVSEMYAGGIPPQYNVGSHEPPRPQTTQPYYQQPDAPPLRYEMNDTGRYVPPSHPKLQHAHSVPISAGVTPTAPNGGKYKNENIL
jgi:hypothetical protein